MARIRPIVNSDKHEQTWSNLSQDAGTANVTVELAHGVALADKNSVAEVAIGSHIKWIYFEFHFSPAETGNVNVVHWEVLWRPNSMSIISPNTYYQSGRKYILKRGMEMLPVNVSTVFKRIFVVKIPKKYQRIGDGDRITFVYRASSTQQINSCGIAVYKEIY